LTVARWFHNYHRNNYGLFLSRVTKGDVHLSDEARVFLERGTELQNKFDRALCSFQTKVQESHFVITVLTSIYRWYRRIETSLHAI